eukprot:1157345-Pelagomonas_calceolata.AAC.2
MLPFPCWLLLREPFIYACGLPLAGGELPFAYLLLGGGEQRLTYHHWCALPTKNAHVTYSPYILELPKCVVRSKASLCPYSQSKAGSYM